MGNIFCTVEDDNKNQYILTDKNKQPLFCISSGPDGQLMNTKGANGTCKKFNFKKYLDNPSLIKDSKIDEQFIFSNVPENQNIPCRSISETITAIPIAFSLEKEIGFTHPIPKSNINFNNYDITTLIQNPYLIQSKSSKTIEETKTIDIFREFNDRFDKSLNKEDARKIDPNAPAPAPAPTQVDYKLIAIFGLIVLLFILAIIFI